MVEIPTYQQRSTTPNADYNPTIPQDQSWREAGDKLDQAVSGYINEKHHEQVQTAAKGADVAFTEATNDLLYTGQDPYMAQGGTKAVAGLEPTLAGLQGAYERVSANLDPAAKRMFDSVALPKMAALRGDLQAYSMKQGRVAQDEVSLARQDQSTEEYGRYVSADRPRADQALLAGESELQTRLERAGAQAEVIDNEKRQYRSKVFAAAVTQQLDYDPHAAQKVLEEHAGEIDPLVAAGLHAKVKSDVDRIDAFQSARSSLTAATAPRPPVPDAKPATHDTVQGLITTAIPGARFTSGPRTPEENRRVGGADNSNHLTTNGGFAWDFTPPAGVPLAVAKDRAVASLQAQGIRVKEALVEHAGDAHSTGDHVHISWDGKGGPGQQPAIPLQANGLPDRAAFVQHGIDQAGDDPQRQMAFEQEYSSAWGQLHADKVARDDAATDAVQPYLRDPKITSIGQIPSRVWAALPEDAKTTVKNHYQAIADKQAEDAAQQQRLDLAAKFGAPLDPHSEADRKALDNRYVAMAQGWKPEDLPARTLEFIKTYRLVPNTAQRMVEGGMRSADPEQRMRAAQLYGAIVAVSPASATDFAEHERNMASAFLDYTGMGLAPKDALARIDADARMNPEQTKARDAAFREEAKNPKFDPQKLVDERLKREAQNGLLSTQAQWRFGPFSGPQGGSYAVPATMMDEIKNTAQVYYRTNGGNIRAAYAAAYDTARNVWGPSTLTGSKAFVKNAPEVIYGQPGKTVEQNAEWIAEQAQKRAAGATGKEVKGLTLQEAAGARVNGRPAYYLMHEVDGTPMNVRDKQGRAVVFQPDWSSSDAARRAKERTQERVREAKARRGRFIGADVADIAHSLELTAGGGA